MRILIVTDAFPPTCGGSGWSTYELTRGLRQRGHYAVVVQPTADGRPWAYDGIDVTAFPAPAPSLPFVRNYARNERLYPKLDRFLRDVIARERIDIVHGQHVLSGPAAIGAARASGIPAVCTVRDYWPVCYWGDLLRRDTDAPICPQCSARAMVSCLPLHAGGAWPLTLPAIPYMRSNLRMKQATLAQADAVIAVSRSVEADLRARAPELARTRVEAIPNAVDVRRIRVAAGREGPPAEHPYALFIGKLTRNKGARLLVEVIQRAALTMPLVVAGDGPDRTALLQAAAAAGRDVRVLGWRDRDEVFRWLAHAQLLVFPSVWKEPLSRVLLEASALGVPMAAMDTGGTSDIIVHGETGLLSQSAEALASDVTRLSADEALRATLRAGAARRAEALFDIGVVVKRMERLYTELIGLR
ncbi:MAG: glycosyltransferase family 4 protein [Vicinamibacterales bacterium]